MRSDASPSINNLQANVTRYYCQNMNEKTLEEEECLVDGLSVLSVLSNLYFRTQRGFYCRAAVWIGNDLVVTASYRSFNQSSYHAEEIVAKALYKLYHHDEQIVKDGQIKVKKMYIDIEPCDGKRYGQNHHCRQFFTKKGRNIEHRGKKINVRIVSEGNIYWNSPLPAPTQGTQIRSDILEVERDQAILGIDLRAMHHNIDQILSRWESCYLIDGESIEKINLSALLKHQENENPVSFEMEQLIKRWEECVNTKLTSAPLDSLNLLNHSNKPEHKYLWHWCLKAIVNNWSLALLIRQLDFSLEEINAIRIIQSWYQEEHKSREITEEIWPSKDSLLSPERNAPQRVPNYLIPKFHYALRNKSAIYLRKYLATLKTNYGTAYYSLLSAPNKSGLTPLNQLFLGGNVEKLLIYWVEVNQAIKQGYLKRTFLHHLLTNQTRDGFTLMHEILKNGEPDIATFYFKALVAAQVNKFINNSEYKKLLIGTTNGNFTPVLQALTAGKSENTALYFKLLTEAHADGIINDREYRGVLITANVDGFTPLQQALVTAQRENAALYFKVFDAAYANGIISIDDYRNVLTAVNQDGFTPLQSALAAAQPDNAAWYFKKLESAYLNQIITTNEYKNVLLNATEEGYSPLNTVLIAGEPENAAWYFKALESAYLNQIITTNEYKNAMIGPNREGYSPLTSALIAGEPKNAAWYFKALELAYLNQIISVNEYKNTLIRVTQKGYSPIYSALMSGQPDSAAWYLKTLKSAYLNKIISQDEYKNVLIGATHFNSTPLHYALKSGQQEIAAMYFEILEVVYREQLISHYEYKTLLMSKDLHGFTPLHEALQAGQIENMFFYLKILESAYHGKIINTHEYKQMFTAITTAGFNCLHQAAMSGNLRMLREFVAYIDSHFSKPESKEILLLLLQTQNRYGFLPSCPSNHASTDAANINKYLWDLRKIYGASGNSKGRKRNFSRTEMQSLSEAKIKEARIEPQPKYQTAPAIHLPQRKRKSLIMNEADTTSSYSQPRLKMPKIATTLFQQQVHNIIDKTHRQSSAERNQYDREEPEAESSSFATHITRAPTFFKKRNTPASSPSHLAPKLETFILILNNRPYEFSYDWHRDDKLYKTFCTNYTSHGREGKAYFISLKENKPAHHNFTRFREKEKEENALFIIRSPWPANSSIYLPSYMQCFISPQDSTVKIVKDGSLCSKSWQPVAHIDTRNERFIMEFVNKNRGN